MDDATYFARRAEQEALAAANAACPESRAAHELIARRYAALAAELAPELVGVDRPASNRNALDTAAA